MLITVQRSRFELKLSIEDHRIQPSQKMKIEHFAYQVEHTKEVAAWYCEHLNFQIKRAEEVPNPVCFMADETGQVMLEVYTNPQVSTPDYRSMHPLLLHIAFCCEDIEETAQRLVAAGATLFSGPEALPNEDELAMLRDPWGLAIQLCKRAQPMV